MRSKAIHFSVVVSTLLLLMAMVPYVLDFSSPIELSSQSPDFDRAIKPKLLRLPSGRLIAVYNDALEMDAAAGFREVVRDDRRLRDPAHAVLEVDHGRARPAGVAVVVVEKLELRLQVAGLIGGVIRRLRSAALPPIGVEATRAVRALTWPCASTAPSKRQRARGR